MPRPSRLSIALTLLATTFNLAILAMNLSVPSRAAVSGMDHKALIADLDFTQAVKSIIRGCRVNIGLAKISC